MKAVDYNESGAFKIIEMPDLAPTSGEVLVQVRATALNRADLLQVKGLYPPPPGESEILGLEIAGEVLATGAGVRRWQKGDRVCALLAGGGYANRVCVHEDMVIPIPENLSFVQAAAIPEVFLTAYQTLVLLGDIQKDHKVMIHAGASGVGTAAIQLVRYFEADSMVTASAGKHDICLELGTSLAVDYNAADFEKEALEWTAGKGVNIILDFIGGDYFNKNLRSLATDGVLIQIAFMGGAKVGDVDLSLILRKRLRIVGTTLRARSLEYKINLISGFLRDVMPAIASGDIVPVIDSVYDWEEVEAAHRYMSNNLNKGKIILEVKE